MASKTPLLQPAQGSSAWNEPLNANFQTVTNALGNILSVSASSGYAFSSDDATNLGFILTGSLGSAQNVTIPNSIVGSWIVVNSTSGAGAVTFKTVSGTGVQLSSGATILYSDGTNIYSAIAGSGASYLPTNGGTISGNLSVTGDFGVTGTSTLGNTTIPAGKTFTIASGATFSLSGAFSPSFISLGGSQVSPYLLTLTGVSAGGAMAYMNGLVTIPSGTGNGLQIGTSDGLGGNRLVVNGTSNFVGNVSITSGNTLTISGGSTSGTNRLAVTGDASVSGVLTAGTFSPTSISATGQITTSASGSTAIYAPNGSVSASGLSASTLSISGSSNLATTSFSGTATFNGGGVFKTQPSVDTSTPAINMRNSSGTTYGQFYTVISSGTGFSYSGGTNAYVGTSPSSGMFCSGPYTNTSDARLKTNVQTISGALPIIKSLRGVYFNFNDDIEKRQVGLIAQEVNDHLPEVVSKNNEGYFGVQYSSIVGVLINAVKELEARVAELEAKII